MSTSSSNPEQEPPWAQIPQQEWLLVEIKDGVEVSVHKLNRSCLVIGRAADQVDIPLQHESASRQHARIAFDTTGTPWLRDLQSTHGVIVNKKRLPAAAVGREESNSTKPGARGVVIYPGDILQFGASTRVFCVEGPPEFERGAIRRPMESNTPTALPVSKQTAARLQHESASDGDESEGDQDRPAHLLTDDTIPEPHRKDWERLKALRYKLENIKQESERIRVKDELSTGQERQLERNDERATKLEGQIREKEAELYRKVYPEHRRAPSHRETASGENEDDDDDFFDRTKDDTSDQLELDHDGETEQSLLTKWNDLQQQRRRVLDDLDRQQQSVSRLEQRVESLQANSDE